MKPYFAIWALLLLIAALPARGASAPATVGGTQMDRHTTELTVKLLVDELQRQWAAHPVTVAELESWQQPIMETLIDPEAARRHIEKLYAEKLQAGYAERVDALWQELLAAQGDPAILTDAACDAAAILPPAVIAENLAKNFPAPYQESRQNLVEQQRQQLTGMVYPTESEVEANNDKALAALLRDRLVQALAQPVWAENLAFLESKRIQPEIVEARRQRNLQIAEIKTADLSSIYDPAEAAVRLRESALAQLNARRAGEPKRHWYDLFPGVETAIAARTGNLLWDKVRQAVSTAAAPADEVLITRILATPGNFSDPAATSKLLQEEYIDQLLTAAVDQVAAAAPDEQRESVKSGLKRNAVPGDLLQLANQLFDRDVLPKLPGVRQTAAQRQFAAVFPVLAQQRWIAPPEAVESRQDPAKDFESYRTSAAPESDPATLLPETVTLATTAVRAALDHGETARKDQIQVMEKIYVQLEQDLKAVSERRDNNQGVTLIADSAITGVDLTRLPQLKELTDIFTRQVQTQWSSGSSTYPALFPSVQREIEIRAKALLTGLRREESVIPPPPPTPKEEIPLSFVITISRPGENIQVELTQTDSDLQEQLTCPMLPGSYRQHEPEVLKQTSRWIAERVLAAQAKAGKSALKLSIQIEVKDGWIYYQFVSRMQSELKEAFRDQKVKVEDILL